MIKLGHPTQLFLKFSYLKLMSQSNKFQTKKGSLDIPCSLFNYLLISLFVNMKGLALTNREKLIELLNCIVNPPLYFVNGQQLQKINQSCHANLYFRYEKETSNCYIFDFSYLYSFHTLDPNCNYPGRESYILC